MNAIAESTAVVTAGEVAQDGAAKGSKMAVGGPLKSVKLDAAKAADYARRRQDKWLNKLSNEVCINGLQYPWWGCLPPEDCPEWVRRVQQEYFRATFVRFDFKNCEITPMKMGGFLGHECAYAVWMIESVNAMIEEAIENPDKYRDVVMTKEEREKALNFLRRLNEWYAGLRHLAGRALKSCVYQSYEDMSGFLSAYCVAFNRKPKLKSGFGDFGNTAFAIYHFMLWRWRGIERLGSVRELHEVLRRQLGEYRVGDLKRVEKICQRIGLHFRKPGRPKASD